MVVQMAAQKDDQMAAQKAGLRVMSRAELQGSTMADSKVEWLGG